MTLALAALVVETFQRYLGIEQDLSPASRLLEDLAIDSLALVTILFELEDRLDLDLAASDVQIDTLATLQDVISLIETLVAAQRSASGD